MFAKLFKENFILTPFFFDFLFRFFNRPTAKAHFVEPQRPIRDEKRRVSLPPRIFRPTLSLSPEDETEEGPASLGQPTSTSSFVKRAQSTDASYTGIFSTGNQQNPQQSRGRLVFQEPPLQEKRSGARQASISNSPSQQPSSSNRPPLLSTRSEDEGFRPCLGAHSSRRDVVSDGEVDSNALSGRQSSTSVPHQRQAHISRSQNLQLQSHSRDPSQADSTATPSASRKSTLKFAASPTAASDRRTKSDRLPHIGQLSLHPTRGSGEVRSNISSDDEAYSDQIYLNGGTRFQEPKEKRSGIDHKSSFNDTRISSSPAHARPLSSRERINSRSSSRSSSPPPLSRSVKGKQPLSSRSPAHANLKIRNIMPYTGDAEDEESEDESQDSDEKESEDESEDQESDSEDLDEEEDGPTDDQDDGEEEEEDDDDDDEPLARQTVLSEFNQARLKRNHSLSRSLDDDDDSASILAPSIDSRDLHHPMSFLPSAFEESMEESSSSPHLSFEDVSTSTQMKSFVREQYPYTSPPLSPTSGYGQAGGLGKRRQLSWGLKLPNGKKAGNVEDASNLESTTPGRSGSRPSTPRVMSETTAPKTPRTLSGGFTPNRARCTPSQQVSSVNQEAVARSPPSNGAWSALRNYLEAPSSFNGSPNSTPNAGTGGAFFHLNHLHQQLDQEQEKQDKAWRGSYLRSKSQGSPITRIESSRMGSDSYFNHKESIIRSAPSTPPTSSFLASEQPPPSALDLVRSTNSKPNAQPQRSIKIVSPPIPKERDGLALSNNKKRRPRTAVNEERVGNGSLHFNKQDLLDRFNPRRRRRSGGIIGGKEEMEFGWGRAR